MIKKIAIAIALVLSLQESYARNAVESDTTVYYSINVTPFSSDSTVFDVTMNFFVQSDTALYIRMPQDIYGLGSLHRFINYFEVKDGCKEVLVENGAARMITPNSSRKISIQYRLTYMWSALEGATYAPALSATNFSLAFCQWMLIIKNRNALFNYDIQLTAPKGWNLYNSVDARHERMQVRAAGIRLASSVLGGTTNKFIDYDINGRKLTVVVASDFDIPTTEIADAAYKIVKTQRAWYNDFDFPFFYVVVNPKPENLAGVCIQNMFKCFIDKKSTTNGLYNLFSHEMFHVWLGQRISIDDGDKFSINQFQWFHEGVNEYFARVVLREMKLVNESQWVDQFNIDVINIANDRYRNYTLQQFSALGDSGMFGQEASKLSYYRGALLALRWHDQLLKKKNGKSLKDFISYLFELYKRSPGRAIPESELFTAGEKFGISVKEDYERYIVRGESIDIPASIESGRWQLQPTTINLFDIGFNLDESYKTKVVTGLKEGSAAWKAGLKNGMTFISISNAGRFSHAYRHDLPLTVKVREEGIEKVIKYMPLGNQADVKLYKKKK